MLSSAKAVISFVPMRGMFGVWSEYFMGFIGNLITVKIVENRLRFAEGRLYRRELLVDFLGTRCMYVRCILSHKPFLLK